MSSSDDEGPPAAQQSTGAYVALAPPPISGSETPPLLRQCASTPGRRGSQTSFSLGSPTHSLAMVDRGRSFCVLAGSQVFARPLNSRSGSFALAEEDSPRNTMKAASNNLQLFIEMNGSDTISHEGFILKKGPRIGSGGYAVVFGGLNTTTDELVAIKEIDVGESSASQFKDVALEFDLLRKIRHPHVVRYILFEHSVSQRVCRIAMEFMPGGSTADVLSRFGPLPEGILKTYAKQMFLGLEFIHSEGITHRDIKPANLLIHAGGALKLADFGCGKRISEMSSATSHILGTPVYMAPETIAGNVHQKSDVWAAGATLLELYTGEQPWSETKIVAHLPLMFHIMNCSTGPEIPEDASPLFRDFLAKCFTHSVDERKSAAELVNHEWFTSPTRELNPLSVRSIAAQIAGENVTKITGFDIPKGKNDPEPKSVPQELRLRLGRGGREATGSWAPTPIPGLNAFGEFVSDDEAELPQLAQGSVHISLPVEKGDGTTMNVDLDVQSEDLKVTVIDRKPSVVLKFSEGVRHKIAARMGILRSSGSRPTSEAESPQVCESFVTSEEDHE